MRENACSSGLTSSEFLPNAQMQHVHVTGIFKSLSTAACLKLLCKMHSVGHDIPCCTFQCCSHTFLHNRGITLYGVDDVEA
jgi:hypothetical protein